VTWRSKARDVAYQAYEKASSGTGLKANATIAAQLIATGDPHHPLTGAIAASTAVAAIIADTLVALPDPTVPYATFNE